MIKIKKPDYEAFPGIEKTYTLPVLLLILLPVFLCVEDFVSAAFLGIAAMAVFLFVECIMFLMEPCIEREWQRLSGYVMLLAAGAITSGVFLRWALYEKIHCPLYLLILEQEASVLFLKELLVKKERKKETKAPEETETAEIKEVIEPEKAPEEAKNQVFSKQIGQWFVCGMEWLLFLVAFGFIREFFGKLIVGFEFPEGGFLLAAGLFFLWKKTKTLPEALEKLPIYTLGTAFVLYALSGFWCLL